MVIVRTTDRKAEHVAEMLRERGGGIRESSLTKPAKANEA